MTQQAIEQKDWQRREKVHREDGELVGVIVPHGQLWRPCTVFGVALGDIMSEAAARDLLTRQGMTVLADRWELRDGDDVITVQIREATPEQVTIAFADYGYPDKFGQRLTLKAPVTQLRHVG